jgi:hypothetical protein
MAWLDPTRKVVYAKNYYQQNKEKFKQRSKISQQKKQAFINELKNKPCLDCGISYKPWIMQFDHRNPKDKLFNIAERKNCYGFDIIEKETNKCDVVCANCHAERTHNLWTRGIYARF